MDYASNLKGPSTCLENAGVNSQNVLQILNRQMGNHLTELDDMDAGCKLGATGMSLCYQAGSECILVISKLDN